MTPPDPRPIWIVPEARYDFGAAHPMAPGRVSNTLELAESFALLDFFDSVTAPEMDLDLLARVHDASYIAAVRSGEPHPECGLGTEDNPLVEHMHEIASRVAAGTVEAARQVWQEGRRRAVNIAGGLHHAMPGATSGFCVYNDVACAATWLLEHGCERIAYVDLDAHHGDGVQQIFVDDPRVLTISLHQNPLELFPGTGFATEIGGTKALGSAINVALPHGTGDAGWLRAFDAVVPEALAAFEPQVIISQHGCDSHRDDPLTDLDLTVDGQRASYQMIADLADGIGKWVAVGGGGYAVRSVVPRAWTHLLAIMAGHPIDPATPVPPELRTRWGVGSPSWMSDLVALGSEAAEGRGSESGDVAWTSVKSGWNPSSRIDQAVLATRRAVFPELGLDPEY